VELDVKNLKGVAVDKIELPADIFEAPIKEDLMHQAFVRQMANAHLGTHKTKSRGEVRGGGAKPWRQKGTGRARAGSRRSPIWVGGGRVHTPRPRSYRQKMPRQMRRAALRSALSVKAAQGQIVIVDAFEMESPKTIEMVSILQALGSTGKSLLVLPEPKDAVKKSSFNLEKTRTLDARYLNVRDLLGYETIILEVASIDVIKSYLGTEA